MSGVRSVDASVAAGATARLQQRGTWVVKVGSSVLVGEAGDVLDRRAFCALVEALAKLVRAGRRVVLVSSGAVAVGRRKRGVEKPIGGESLAVKQALAAIGQPLLMHHYAVEFGFYGVQVAQVLLGRQDLSERSRTLNARRTLRALSELGPIVPIINENDTVATDELKFGDNDHLAALVAQTLDADALIILSDVDAVYTADPRRDPTAERIAVAYADDPAMLAVAGPADALGAGTGGMASKLRAAAIAGARGVPTVIAPGRDPDALARLASGDAVGTLLVPLGASLSARKAWIAHGALSGGVLHVDAGACKAIQSEGRSLFPRGIVRVEGQFGEGDAVAIACDDSVFAHGLVAYGAADLSRIVGARSGEIAAILGYSQGDAAIHRDDLVLR